MSIIDAHTHAFPDDLAHRAISSLENDCPWKAIADGRVYTGSVAKNMGLVDDLGGLYDAISTAKNMSKTKGKVTIVYMNEPTVK